MESIVQKLLRLLGAGAEKAAVKTETKAASEALQKGAQKLVANETQITPQMIEEATQALSKTPLDKDVAQAGKLFKETQSTFNNLMAKPEYNELIGYVNTRAGREKLPYAKRKLVFELEAAKRAYDKAQIGYKTALQNAKQFSAKAENITAKEASKEASTTPPPKVNLQKGQRLMSSGDPDKNLLAKIEMPADKIREATKVAKGKIDKSGGNVYSFFGIPDFGQTVKSMKDLGDIIVDGSKQVKKLIDRQIFYGKLSQEMKKNAVQLEKQANLKKQINELGPKDMLGRFLKETEDAEFSVVTLKYPMKVNEDIALKEVQLHIPKYISPDFQTDMILGHYEKQLEKYKKLDKDIALRIGTSYAEGNKELTKKLDALHTELVTERILLERIVFNMQAALEQSTKSGRIIRVNWQNIIR